MPLVGTWTVVAGPLPPNTSQVTAAVRSPAVQAFFAKLYIRDDDQVRSELAEPFATLLGDGLTREAEAALAQEAKNPSPSNGTTGPTSTLEPHTQGVRGSNRRFRWR